MIFATSRVAAVPLPSSFAPGARRPTSAGPLMLIESRWPPMTTSPGRGSGALGSRRQITSTVVPSAGMRGPFRTS